MLERGRERVREALVCFMELEPIHERELVIYMTKRLLAELDYYEKALERKRKSE